MAPLLMLPPQLEAQGNHGVVFLSPDQDSNNKTCLKKNHQKLDQPVLQSHRCVGSSHGSLIFLDEDVNMYLWNPFSGDGVIKLAATENFPNLFSFQKAKVDVDDESDYGFCFLMKYKDLEDGSLVSRSISTLKEAQKSLVRKAILSDPLCHKDSIVIAITDFDSSVLFCKVREERRCWYDLGQEAAVDIMCTDGKIFVLSDDGCIQRWDLNTSSYDNPVKVAIIRPDYSCVSYTLDPDLYTRRCYLVASVEGGLYLVQRIVGEFVNDDGLPVYEHELLDGPTNQPLVYPYRTLEFNVYKLDCLRCEWKKIASIEDQAMFLGGNHSVCMSVEKFPWYKGNSIYFTDDYWLRTDEDYMYGGHDIGVFSLSDGSATQFYPCDDDLRLDPPPFWLLPSS